MDRAARDEAGVALFETAIASADVVALCFSLLNTAQRSSRARDGAKPKGSDSKQHASPCIMMTLPSSLSTTDLA